MLLLTTLLSFLRSNRGWNINMVIFLLYRVFKQNKFKHRLKNQFSATACQSYRSGKGQCQWNWNISMMNSLYLYSKFAVVNQEKYREMSKRCEESAGDCLGTFSMNQQWKYFLEARNIKSIELNNFHEKFLTTEKKHLQGEKRVSLGNQKFNVIDLEGF